ncbi:Universal stress protein [Arthrobacter saudimassiliensis]|uniref:Universal stress protein n=1 Tax=Arthrobacter saudimassiliensis TaxID=1461584 RepID=A0A078MLD7_9MICC|nr:Universal stress protein [Arthrobacter saudimassiliensis]
MSVVVGYIETPEGRAALEAGRAAAVLLREQLVIINVSGPHHGLRHLPTPEDEEKALAAVDRSLAAEGLAHAIVHPVGDYDPAEEILRVAADHAASLLVLGIRRRTPVGKLIMGSTAQRVLLEADCPVLTVRPGPD